MGCGVLSQLHVSCNLIPHSEIHELYAVLIVHHKHVLKASPITQGYRHIKALHNR